MISFNYETDFELHNESHFTQWLSAVILSENKKEGEINYIFCDDDYLLKLNQQYLDHDTLTDIISFDYSVGNELNGDIFVSVERVKENASEFNVTFQEEIQRVLVHGILHFSGYRDKTKSDELVMRSKEEEKMKMFHVEQ
ncbi:MAG: rRNA maturation RNase YbeY [Flavobacteriaceae bacterium]|jgi:rRNA maturation RNase YbeY|nr:rRNA maturation RNase YbeY [Flavobacteriaceae bacterium]